MLEKMRLTTVSAKVLLMLPLSASFCISSDLTILASPCLVLSCFFRLHITPESSAPVPPGAFLTVLCKVRFPPREVFLLVEPKEFLHVNAAKNLIKRLSSEQSRGTKLSHTTFIKNIPTLLISCKYEVKLTGIMRK